MADATLALGPSSMRTGLGYWLDSYASMLRFDLVRMRRWLGVFLGVQLLMGAGFAGVGLTLPLDIFFQASLVLFYLVAFASATQDIAVDAWRIDVADERTPVELLSAVYQFGYRIASIVGGAFALFLAARVPWGTVYFVMAALVLGMMVVAITAPDTQRPPSGAIEQGLEQAGEVKATVRLGALAIVGICWLWAILTLANFMILMLTAQQQGLKPPSVTDFTTHIGPWIIVATVFVPLLISAVVNWLKSRGQGVQREAHTKASGGRIAMNHIYGALVSPLAELSQRLRWGVLIIIGFILTYALCYNIWSSFAFPFPLPAARSATSARSAPSTRPCEVP